VAAVADGRPLPLGAPKQRALLATLLLDGGRVVPRDRLVDALWGDHPPKAAVRSLQVYVHGLRQALGAERIETHGPGYRLRLEPGELDLERFQRLVERGGQALADGRAADAADDLRRALDLWAGPALADLGGEPFAEAEAGRLEDLRLHAIELRTDAELALGRQDAVVAELEGLIAEHPYRERFREQHILALYRSGRQKEALEAYREARSALVDELGVEPRRALQELERGILRQDPSLAAPAPPPPRAEGQLPTPPTPLVGRRLEVAAVAGLLRRDDVRLVTLTGPGGSGKTRLALAVAEELATELRDGALFVDLAPVRDPTLLVSSVARALGLQEGEEPLPLAIAQHLRERSLLMLLDNLEQLLPGTPFIAELLAAAPRLLVLATSRAPLRLSGEHEYPVPPLPTPGANRTSTFEELTTNDAVRLFVARARAVDLAFELTDARVRDVAEICMRLDGLPLAIELAAARSKLLPAKTIARRLERALEFLTGGARDLPARQQTLRATLDWSHELLSEPERTLFARLAVFVGGCTIDAAEAVCADDDIDVLTTIASLADESLLRRVGDDRLAMLETIREYALERLESSTEEAELRRRHAEYFLELAEHADQAAKAAGGAGQLELLELEHDNLRAALGWLHEAGEPEPALRLANALSRFWWLRGYASEGRRWLAVVLERSDGQPPQLRTEALRRAAVLAGVQGDYEIARELAEESRALYEALGDRHGVALSVSSIAESLLHEGEYKRARQLYEHALALFSELGDEWDVAAATVNLGYVALGEGDYARATALAEEGLAHFRTLGDPQSTATAVYVLGTAALANGDRAEARRHLEESLQLHHQVGDKEGAAECLHALAAAIARDDPEGAAELAGAAEALREEAGSSLARFQLEWRDRTSADIRRTIGDEAWSAAFERGRAMPLEAALTRLSS
jgi:predicted ATPase/DNA-binding SARP family transcriptional activator